MYNYKFEMRGEEPVFEESSRKLPKKEFLNVPLRLVGQKDRCGLCLTLNSQGIFYIQKFQFWYNGYTQTWLPCIPNSRTKTMIDFEFYVEYALRRSNPLLSEVPVWGVLKEVQEGKTFDEYIQKVLEKSTYREIGDVITFNPSYIKFSREFGNKNKNTFDFIDVDVRLPEGFTKDSLSPYIKQITELVNERVREKLGKRKYGIPLEFFKTDSITLKKDGTLHYVMSLKDELLQERDEYEPER